MSSPEIQILVVDDDPDTADSFAEILQDAGHRVRIARDGQAAVLMAAADLPDIILLDVGLPDIDGYAVAECILALAPPDRRPYLIAATGFSRPLDRQLSAAAGIDLHLAKPVAPEALLAAVAERVRVRADGQAVHGQGDGAKRDGPLDRTGRLAVRADGQGDGTEKDGPSARPGKTRRV
jgi:CheY-like chemotaxis protein